VEPVEPVGLAMEGKVPKIDKVTIMAGERLKVMALLVALRARFITRMGVLEGGVPLRIPVEPVEEVVGTLEDPVGMITIHGEVGEGVLVIYLVQINRKLVYNQLHNCTDMLKLLNFKNSDYIIYGRLTH